MQAAIVRSNAARSNNCWRLSVALDGGKIKMEAMTLVVRMLASIGTTRGEEICWARANILLTTCLRLNKVIFSQVKSKREVFFEKIR